MTKFFFVYNKHRYYNLKSFCTEYGVRYSSACYFVNKYIATRHELNDFLYENPDVLDVLIDKFTIKGAK